MPKFDLSSIPGLDTAQGIFGSLKQEAGIYDDTVVDIMVLIYDSVPPPPPGIV